MRYLMYFIILLVFAVGLSIVGWYFTVGESPPLILDKLESLKNRKSLMDSIGGYKSYEFRYNERAYETFDTLTYSIIITGASAKIIYKGFQSRVNGKWELTNQSILIEDR